MALIARHGLTFPVGHSADAAAIAAATGAFVDPVGGYLQSTGFVLDPPGHVVVSVYSSGAIGRLMPEDVVGLIRYVREHAASTPAATGMVGHGVLTALLEDSSAVEEVAVVPQP